MDLLAARRLPRRAHHADLGARPRRAADADDAAALAERRGRRDARRASTVYVVGLQLRQPRRRRSPTQDQADFAALRRGARAAVPDAPRPHRRQRAEPQPLLAAAVRRRRQRRGRAGVRVAARADLRRGEGGRRRASTVLGGAVSPRGGDDPAASGRTRTRRRSSSTTSAPRTARAAGRRRSWTASRSTRTRTTRASPPTFAHPNTTTIALADYDKLVALLGDGVRRHRAARLDAADPLRRVRRRVADPGGEGGLYTGTEPATTKPVDEATQARVLPAGGRSSRSASRTCAGSSSSTPSTRRDLDRLAVRALLRRRHAEVEPAGGRRPRVDESRRGVDRALRRASQLTPSSDGRVRRSVGADGARALTCDLDCIVRRAARAAARATLARREARPARRRHADARCRSARRVARGQLPLHGRADGAGEPRPAGATAAALRSRRLAFHAMERPVRRVHASTASTRPGGGCRSRSAHAGKDAFAEVVEDWARALRRTCAPTRRTGVRPGLRLLPLEDHRALRRPRRARRRAERRRRSPAGSRRRTRTSRRRRRRSTRARAAPRKIVPQRLAVPRRLPVREGAAVVRALGGGPPARDGRAHPRSAARSSRRSTTTRPTRSGSTTRSS